MLKEFKEFAIKGNVVDMAVGIVIGAGFGKIVSSFVADILMPPVGMLMGKMDFSNMYVNLSGKEFPSLKAAKEAGAATINYGVFLNTMLDFVFVAFAIFLLVRMVNRWRATPPPPPADPTTKECPFCVMSIPIKATKCGHCTSEIAKA